MIQGWYMARRRPSCSEVGDFSYFAGESYPGGLPELVKLSNEVAQSARYAARFKLVFPTKSNSQVLSLIQKIKIMSRVK